MDTSAEAQAFLIQRLRQMSPRRRLEICGASVAAGLSLTAPELGEMNPFAVAARVTGLLERENVEYFLGGSMASTVHGEPRFTQDVDIIVRLDQHAASTLLNELKDEFYISEPALREAIERKGSANLIHLATNFKIDLMVSPGRAFEASAFARKVRLETSHGSFYFCTPEDIVLAKLEWLQRSQGILDRQLRDIQTVLMVQQSVDLGYLRLWAAQLGVSEQLEQSLKDADL